MPNPKKIVSEQTFLQSFKLEELSEANFRLISMAKEAALKAYAPYSGFRVGVALMLENGEIFQANNQENVSFPVGICAERLVLGYVHANYPNLAPIKIAIAANRAAEENSQATVSPCGLCRQTINEYENKFGQPIEIFMLGPNGQVFQASGIGALLPFKFDDLNQ
ncbi:cytidine deaminase [Pleomorphovibrio marinus]|uniref:cytidine deaminase n=1 Tax=Pleomorphovibrio marinus TaxID=2164132 RepID=UPI000E0AC213|nr:cytidine deaminase [Pleomorphovibrio marinus]